MPNSYVLRKTIFAIVAILLLYALFVYKKPQKNTDVHFRYNQASYLAHNSFDLYVFVKTQAPPNKVLILDKNKKDISSLKWTPEGPYNQFFKYKINVPSMPEGRYYILFDDQISPPIEIANASNQTIALSTLDFFKFQRCGFHKNKNQKTCHQLNHDLVGGWHDAGDYIRFALTTSFATTLILNSAQFSKNSNFVSRALDEAEWGISWLDKMWSDQKNLRSQISDGTDHDLWRLPDEDDFKFGPQKVYYLKNNEGANIAGRMVASFALFAKLVPEREKSLYWQRRAQEIYGWAQRMKKSSSTTEGFYVETQWQEDMALGALELYHLTANRKYLDDAIVFLKQAANPYTFDYANLHILSFFKLAFYEKSLSAYSEVEIKKIVQGSVEMHKKNPFGVALDKYFWGSHMHICGMAIGGLLLDRLGSKGQLKNFYLTQWNYLLGVNPWGVSFIGLAGQSPRWPHHQIVDLQKQSLPAFWVPGPVPRQQWNDQKISLAKEDSYLDFQSNEAVYFDDKNDYMTNEPTLTMSATGLFLSVLMEMSGAQ